VQLGSDAAERERTFVVASGSRRFCRATQPAHGLLCIALRAEDRGGFERRDHSLVVGRRSARNIDGLQHASLLYRRSTFR
jgi:hypothetical protein